MLPVSGGVKADGSWKGRWVNEEPMHKGSAAL